MKSILLILFAVLNFPATADTTIIELAASGRTRADLIPAGWKLLASSTGDLNKDGVADLAFVIQQTDPRNFEISDAFTTDTVDLNPRVLAVYFGSSSGLFKKELQANEFILLKDSPVMEEPLGELEITDKGVLQIGFRFWSSAGSWSMSSHAYKFRYQNQHFELIGYDSYEMNRASGETTEHSINFLSKKIMVSKGSVTEEQPDAVEWHKFQLDSLKTIETLKTPFSWQFQDTYI